MSDNLRSLRERAASVGLYWPNLSLLAAKTYARDALEPLPSFSAFFRAETLFQAL